MKIKSIENLQARLIDTDAGKYLRLTDRIATKATWLKCNAEKQVYEKTENAMDLEAQFYDEYTRLSIEELDALAKGEIN